MTMTKEQVLRQFQEGFDCAQVVFAHWAERLGYDRKKALMISTGFGAGMMQGESCGAVIGAYMAIGLKYGMCEKDEKGAEQKGSAMIKDLEFRQKLLEKYPSCLCRELLGADFATAEGKKIISEKDLLNTFCPQLVADVMDILEEIM